MLERSAKEIMEGLKRAYSFDENILSDIAMYEKDIEYIENQMKTNPNYHGQTPLQFAQTIEAGLEYWEPHP